MTSRQYLEERLRILKAEYEYYIKSAYQYSTNSQDEAIIRTRMKDYETQIETLNKQIKEAAEKETAAEQAAAVQAAAEQAAAEQAAAAKKYAKRKVLKRYVVSPSQPQPDNISVVGGEKTKEIANKNRPTTRRYNKQISNKKRTTHRLHKKRTTPRLRKKRRTSYKR